MINIYIIHLPPFIIPSYEWLLRQNFRLLIISRLSNTNYIYIHIDISREIFKELKGLFFIVFCYSFNIIRCQRMQNRTTYMFRLCYLHKYGWIIFLRVQKRFFGRWKHLQRHQRVR